MTDHFEYIKTVEKIYLPTLIPSRCEEDKCKGCEWFKYKTETYCVRPRLEECKRGLSMPPSRPTGHWIKTPKAVMGEGYMWYCDKCEHQVYQDSSRPYPSEKYCSNCGCRMVEPQERSE